MGKALGLRDDYDASSLRLLARKTNDVRVARRLLALACVYDGMDRSAAAKAGIDRQSLRDRVIAFNAKGPDGLCDGKRCDAPAKLNAAGQAKLKQIVLSGPDPEFEHVVRWRCPDLQEVIKSEFDITVSEVTVGRLLRRLASPTSAPDRAIPPNRPEPLQLLKNFAVAARDALKDKSLAPEKPVEIWYQSLPSRRRGMRRVADRRMASLINGHPREKDHANPRTSAMTAPTSSVPSARRAEQVLLSSCLMPTPKR